MSFKRYISLVMISGAISIAMPLLSAGLGHGATGHDWDRLIKAIEKGDLGTVKSLVSSKIKANEKTRGGRSLISIAVHHKQQEVARYLAWELIVPAIEHGDLATVKTIIPNILQAHDKTHSGRELLNIARYHKQQAIVDYMQSTLGGAGAGAGAGAHGGRAGVIKFYTRGEPYYEFTNFAETPIDLDGKKWATTEHYFQAQKFTDLKIQEDVRNAATARDAFDLANGRTGRYKTHIRANWDASKDGVMLKAVRAKFAQHAHLARLLLSTGTATLEEASPVDSYWGTGADGKGENKLGKILMQVREELRKGSPAACAAAAPAKSVGWTKEHDQIAAILSKPPEFGKTQLEQAIDLATQLKFGGGNLRATSHNKTLRDMADELNNSPWFDKPEYKPSAEFKEQWSLLRDLLSQ